jgi:hypothetical protein
MTRFFRSPSDTGVLAFGLAVVLFAGCSGTESGSGYAEARQAYQQSATKRTDDVAGPIAVAYVERLASGPSDEAFFKQFDGQLLLLTDSLCADIEDLRGKAGSGKAKTARLDELRVASEDLVRDRFVTALLGRILSASPEQREELLNTVGVKATATDGAEIPGSAALKEVNLLDSQGQIAIPARGTNEYVRYERWLSSQARGFGGINSKLMGDTREEIERCASSA